MDNVRYAIMACRERMTGVSKTVSDLKQYGIEAEIFWDDKRVGPWLNSKRFWDSLKEGYGVLLQDDVGIGAGFRQNVEGVIQDGRLETAATGFILLKDRAKLEASGLRYYRTANFWGQCNIFSAKFAQEFLAWEAANCDPGNKKSDDGRMTAFFLCEGAEVFTTIPSLVQHLDERSTLGHAKMMFGRPRTSEFVADRVYDWTRTKENTGKIGFPPLAYVKNDMRPDRWAYYDKKRKQR